MGEGLGEDVVSDAGFFPSGVGFNDLITSLASIIISSSVGVAVGSFAGFFPTGVGFVVSRIIGFSVLSEISVGFNVVDSWPVGVGLRVSLCEISKIDSSVGYTVEVGFFPAGVGFSVFPNDNVGFSVFPNAKVGFSVMG